MLENLPEKSWILIFSSAMFKTTLRPRWPCVALCGFVARPTVTPFVENRFYFRHFPSKLKIWKVFATLTNKSICEAFARVYCRPAPS